MNNEQRNALILYRIDSAKSTLQEIPVHIANGFYKTAMNRMYYACYYMVSALLISKEIEAQTHAGVRQMFGLHFVKTSIVPINLGKFYTDLFANRQESDYVDFVYYDENVLNELYPIALEFIERIELIIRDNDF